MSCWQLNETPFICSWSSLLAHVMMKERQTAN